MGSCLSSVIKSKPPLRKEDDRPPEEPLDTQIKGEILQSPNLKSFCFSELKKATGGFYRGYYLGGGNFGLVFKAWIDEHSLEAAMPNTGMPIAVKKLDQKRCQGQQEWLTEIKFLGQLCHPNLVKLIGYSLEDDQRLLVYEFMPNGSLENHIFGKSSDMQPLSWNLRMKVALGAARCLKFLHDEVNAIYRDFKVSDILLDENYNAKLSDFGLARDGPMDDETHVTTRVMGTKGYMCPEYVATGHLTRKSDVFSFGVVFLEILSGRQSIEINRPPGEQNLVEWAKASLRSKRNGFQVLDKRMEGQYKIGAAQKALHLARRCLSKEVKDRPNMEQVVEVLEELYIRKQWRHPRVNPAKDQ